MKRLPMITRAVSLILLANVSMTAAQQLSPISVNKTALRLNQSTNQTTSQVNGKQTYIIQLLEPSVAQYNGGIKGFAATNPKTSVQTVKGIQRKGDRLQASADHVRSYRHYLQQRQQSVLGKIAQITGQSSVRRQLQFAINGMILELTPTQAKQVATLAGVKSVEADSKLTLSSDTGPGLSGATAVWAGNTLAGTNAMGEGTVVAIFDTGINTDHPSFAATGGDGYIHSNPLGSGNFLGDCQTDFPSLCNDKLIGVFSYPQITNNYSDTDIFPPNLPRNGEDYNGHGSHVASTAAGNILYDIPAVGLAFDVEESDGYVGEFTFDQISGIAPHANIMSFQVCQPGENDDEYNGCFSNLAVVAIEDAIASGIVDAINFSISGGEEVWGNTLSEAWLSANNAGIFVAHSAGNDGPDASTSDKLSPWITSVAATTHGRTLDLSKTIGSFTGGSNPPSIISGQSNTGAITADIVYAGDYPNANDPGGDPAQCLEPYPANTFNGEIVLCDRGDIARIQKAINVASGGAGGFVLANVDDGAENLVADEYVIPGIHIAASDGNRLKTWLASGANHRATISATAGIRSVDDTLADKVANFSSRGPNTQFSTLVPMLSAPGTSIYAAYSDQHFGHETTGPAPADYAFLDGTSMASPHVAGAALLLRELHPAWSADAIRSALMMTAETNIGLNGEGTANWLDMGAGRIQIDAAADAGLIMQETQANYLAANPASGGDPKTLNIPALVDNNCLIECSWQRTFIATRSGTWSMSMDNMDSGLSLDTQPVSFTLTEGQSQTVTFTLSTWNVVDNDWAFANVHIDGNDGNPLHVPIAVVASNGNFPDDVTRTSYRDADSMLLEDLLAIEITDFTYDVTPLTRGTKVSGSIATDTAPNDFFDNLNDGVYTQDIEINEGSPRLVAQTVESSALDLDLYIAYDDNADGIFGEDELIAVSAGFSWEEYISIDAPPAGSYRIYVHNFTGSTAQQDSFTLDYAAVGASNDGTLNIDAPSSVALREAFDMRILWSLDNSIPGDRYYGSVALGSSAETPENLGIIPIDIIRGENDVQLTVDGNDRVSPGDMVDYLVNVRANNTNEDRNYEIDVTIPDGTAIVADSITGGGTADGNTISWSITQTATASVSNYRVTTPESDSQCAIPDQHNTRYIDLSALGYAPFKSDSDTMLAAYPVSLNVLDEQWHTITVSSKGYIAPANAPVNTFPAINRMLADESYSSALLAPLWRNWSFSDEATAGITVATLNDGAISVIEWTGLKAGDYSADMEVIINHNAGDGEPSLLYAYQNVSNSSTEALAGTVGWQNSSGQQGDTLAFNDATANIVKGEIESLITSGTVLCLTPNNTVTATGPASLAFSLQVDNNASLTGSLPVTVTSRVPNIPGTQEEIGEVNTDVQMHAAPEILIDGSKQASISLTERQASVLPVTVTDANGDNVSLSVEQLSGPAAVFNVAGEVVTVTPASVEEGTALRLRITATDEFGFTDTATVDITVTPNEPPVLSISAPSSVQEGATITVRASATDPENDTIIFTINGVQGSTFSSTAPDTDDTTSVTFTVTATDGQNSVTETTTVTVTNRPSSSGGSLSLLWLGGLLLVAINRRRKHPV